MLHPWASEIAQVGGIAAGIIRARGLLNGPRMRPARDRGTLQAVEAAVPEERVALRHRRRESRGRGRSRRRQPVDPQRQALRAARRRANARARVYTHWVAYLSVLLLLVVTTRSVRVVAIVAAGWGIALAIHHFVGVVLPRLRRRWVEEEVGRDSAPVVDHERRVVEQRKVRSLEELSASIAHEIRNPVTAAKSLVQQMGEDPTSASNVDFAQVALGELDRVERSISHLLRFARDEALQLETLELGDVVDSALDTFRERIVRDGVRVERDLGAAPFVRGDAEKLRRIVINVVANALDAMAQAGTAMPTLSVSAGENLAGSEAWVRVRDNGPGLDADVRERIFDPFFTTKSSGTGLGLALARKMIESHGGSLEVESRPGGGCDFVVCLPRDPEAGERSAGAPQSERR